MAKAASSTSPRTAAKKAAATTSGSTRKSAEPAALPTEPTPDVLSVLTQRLDGLEEKLTMSLSAIVAEIRTLTPPTDSQPQEPAPDTTLPLIADLIRRSLTEHLNPITAALKRVEERIGFIGNRLKHPSGGGGGGQERQKPWRHDQPRHDQGRHSRPRPHNGPRPGQGQPWTPPSAASVQGHFAPRPRFGGDDQRSYEDEE